MQYSTRNLHGLPLCLSGLTHPLTLSKEMADHDRRRDSMKKQKSQAREALNTDQEMGIHERVLEEIREGKVAGDLADVLHDLSYMCLACTAKAA
ncbi:hypothetical protein F0562_002112 [Nyssa sinensis]|uniref:Uncharacterized protein n=1 Tax=Nyssa sinensis TaxID=561372 RepID=A0A5J5C535_9ASTE|nr:hypothetical protein F0562_002112 [Nyssa sinensis]